MSDERAAPRQRGGIDIDSSEEPEGWGRAWPGGKAGRHLISCQSVASAAVEGGTAGDEGR